MSLKLTSFAWKWCLLSLEHIVIMSEVNGKYYEKSEWAQGSDCSLSRLSEIIS